MVNGEDVVLLAEVAGDGVGGVVGPTPAIRTSFFAAGTQKAIYSPTVLRYPRVG